MYYCYILSSLNPKYKDQTYIGFTDDPLHRIRQHNGLIKGGAKFTSKRKPWKLVMVVSNFPNKIVALKFEWAWQNPFKSNFTAEGIKSVDIPEGLTQKLKAKYYQSLEFKLKALNILLKSKVYDKIFLYIYLFDEVEGLDEFKNLKLIERVNENTFKEAIKKKIYNYDANEIPEDIKDITEFSDKCIICDEIIDNKKEEKKVEEDEDEHSEISDNIEEGEKTKLIISCPYCRSKFHLLCLAKNSLSQDPLSLIPQETTCIICTHSFKWSEWIKDLSKEEDN